MHTYEVTATNCGYYQTLRVTAHNENAALAAFRLHLSSDQNKSWERYEYERQNENDPFHPDDFIYEFSADDIEILEPEFLSREYPDVTLIDSGGNG